MQIVTLKEQICTASGTAGAFLAHAFGPWDKSLGTLMIFMAVDFVMGIGIAGILKKSPKTSCGALESKTGWEGLFRKGISLVFVLIGYRLDILFNSDYIRNTVIIAFMTNELISIVENAGIMGVPLPNAVKNAINILTQKKI